MDTSVHEDDGFAASAAQALDEVTRALADLKSQLDATVRLVVRAMEVEGGRVALPADADLPQVSSLFIRGQQFIESTVYEARRQADAIVAEARVEADRVVQDAREKVRDIVGNYRALAPEALEEVQKAVESFHEANTQLSSQMSG